MKFKGPVFPSFLNQNTSPQAPRMQWKAHCGRKAQLRYLRQACRKILAFPKGTAEWATVQRVEDAVKGEPMPEFGKLHLINAGLEAADQTGESWRTCMNYLMDKFDEMQERYADGGAEQADAAAS